MRIGIGITIAALWISGAVILMESRKSGDPVSVAITMFIVALVATTMLVRFYKDTRLFVGKFL